MNLSKLQATFDTAAKAIVSQPTAAWLGWVTYLLESLDEALSKRDWQHPVDCRNAQCWILINVAHEIEARLKSGGW